MSNIFSDDSIEKFSCKTPFFVFSKEEITKKLKEFEDCFPGVVICYAMKANSEPEILKTIASTGTKFEVASVYELEMLKKIKVSPDKIIYGTSVKPVSGIKEFYDFGVDTYAFDSYPELEKIALVAPGAKVYVRERVSDAGSVFKFSEKFGTDNANIVPLLKRAKELKLKPCGISFHVGSQASNPMAWAHALSNLHDALTELKKLDIGIDFINLGGGFPCSYASSEREIDLKTIAHHTLKAYKKLPYQPGLVAEPGRWIIAQAGILVTSVIARVERNGYNWLFLDAGVYNALFETMAYQGSTRYRITSLRPSYSSGELMFSLAGPTGDSPDIITREALLPQDMEVGDKLVFHSVGAYSLVTSNRFNGFPKPDVYYA